MDEVLKKGAENFAESQKDRHAGDEPDDVSKRNERIRILREFTADDKILKEADRVAFEQKELEDLVQKGEKHVYLCGGIFTIPVDIEGVTYTGVNDPVITIKKGIKVAAGIDIQNVKVDIELFIDETFGAEFSDNKTLYIKILHAAGKQGYIEAERLLGDCYYWGWGVEYNREESAEWYRRAAEQGDENAQIFLASYYSCNRTEETMKEALRWYRKAAEQGNGHAQAMMGYFYAEGLGVEQNKKEAVKWYRKAAAAYLPYLPISTTGLDICKEAAEQGDVEAQFIVGVIYLCAGRAEEVVKWHRKAAEQGDEEAQVSLGNCYAKGWGVERNKKEAVKWYREAAEQGSTEAQYKLGDCYAAGDGVEQNWDEAMRWYRMAAHKGIAYKRWKDFYYNVVPQKKPEDWPELKKPKERPAKSLSFYLFCVFVIVVEIVSVIAISLVLAIYYILEKLGIKKRDDSYLNENEDSGYLLYLQHSREDREHGYRRYYIRYERCWRAIKQQAYYLDYGHYE